MGTFCSNIDREKSSELHENEQQQQSAGASSSARFTKKLHRHHHHHQKDMMSNKAMKTLAIGEYSQDKRTKLDSVKSINEPLEYKDGTLEELVKDYTKDRDEIERRGREIGHAHKMASKADDAEKKANDIIKIIKNNDKNRYSLTETEPKKVRCVKSRYDGQGHVRFPGDHFLTNVGLIEKMDLFKIAQMMPKGAHLHIHFNSCLHPRFLLGVAAQMPDMYIWSDLPLTSKDNLNRCRIQFTIKHQNDFIILEGRDGPNHVKKSLFDSDYDRQDGKVIMQFQEFNAQWKTQCKKQWKGRPEMEKFSNMESQDWLISKLVFNDQEAHDPYQTADGAWEKFNGRTQMMKGLFNYEKAFKDYTKACLEEFVRDNVQYAEIRPNFMENNQILPNKGYDPRKSSELDKERKRGNRKTMDMIIEVWEAFNKAQPKKMRGLKVIYCTPRSFPPQAVRKMLDQCLEFKRDPKYRDYIAGFDLVGEEGKGKPLKDFVPEFLEFKEHCRKGTNIHGETSLERVDIPFLFHCGETLELGGKTDANLIDALLLDSKRIGHGFALTKKPYLMAEFKKRNICLETCPISNEVLGLTPRISGHAIYELLANNVHCTINSDNGTLFRSTLSHDFYQVMVGSDDMDLHGWRQLIEWSIEHASVSRKERDSLYKMWEKQWKQFIAYINTTYPIEKIGKAKLVEVRDPRTGKWNFERDYGSDGL